MRAPAGDVRHCSRPPPESPRVRLREMPGVADNAEHFRFAEVWASYGRVGK
jgi:hypothetical protein